jgi:hypothetical protein
VDQSTPLPLPPPLAAADDHRTLDDRTDELSAVPLTDLSTLHLDSAERPKLSTHIELRAVPADRPWWPVLLIAVAAGAAAVAAFQLTR